MVDKSCVGRVRMRVSKLHGAEADVSEGRRREDDLSIQLGGIGSLDN